jgi:hypothetical protein
MLVSGSSMAYGQMDPPGLPGGCRTYTPAGHSIGICISDRSKTGLQAWPDYYVNDPTMPANCSITVELWSYAWETNSGGPERYWQLSNQSCTPGHHGPWCVDGDWGGGEGHHAVHAYFRLFVDGRQVNDLGTDSPELLVDGDPPLGLGCGWPF